MIHEPRLGHRPGPDFHTLKLAVEKGVAPLFMPVSCRRQLYDLWDVQFFSDVQDVFLKALVE